MSKFTELPVTVKVKRPRATRWKPFHAWLNGKPKEPIVLGLTETQAEAIEYVLDCVLSDDDMWNPEFRAAHARARKLAYRRNLKPLSDREYGEIRSKEF
jgi:hypothetical protein